MSCHGMSQRRSRALRAGYGLAAKLQIERLPRRIIWCLVIMGGSLTRLSYSREVFESAQNSDPAHKRPAVTVVIPPPSIADAQLDALYTTNIGEILGQISASDHGVTRVYFWDGLKLSFNIDPTEAQKLGNVPFALSAFAKEHHIIQLQPSFFHAEFGDYAIQNDTVSAPYCQWPYGAVSHVSYRGSPLPDLIFLTKNYGVPSKIYDLSCEGGPGRIQLSTTYKDLTPIIYVVPDVGLLLAFFHPAIVVRLDNHLSDFGGQENANVLIADGNLSKKLLVEVASRAMTPAQAVKNFESSVAALQQ